MLCLFQSIPIALFQSYEYGIGGTNIFAAAADDASVYVYDKSTATFFVHGVTGNWADFDTLRASDAPRIQNFKIEPNRKFFCNFQWVVAASPFQELIYMPL